MKLWDRIVNIALLPLHTFYVIFDFNVCLKKNLIQLPEVPRLVLATAKTRWGKNFLYTDGKSQYSICLNFNHPAFLLSLRRPISQFLPFPSIPYITPIRNKLLL